MHGRPGREGRAVERLYLSDEDHDMVVLVGCSLDRSPGSNWVERSGGLPEYICEIARAIHRSGRPISQAISIAVSRVKKWAAGLDDVDADTRAKAAKAVAQWEALKARNKGKKAAKKVVKATALAAAPGEAMTALEQIVALAASRSPGETDLDAILRLAAGKPNPFAKGGDKGGGKDTKAPPFGKKSDGDSKRGSGGSGGGLNSAAAVKAAWARLKAAKVTPEEFTARAGKIRAAAKKFNVKLG